MESQNLLEKEKTETRKIIHVRHEALSISPAAIKRVIIGIVLLIVLVHVGFFKTYISYFPKFEDHPVEGHGIVRFTTATHFHGMMMMGWMLMLLVQPILVLKGKITLHRRVGALSYVLAPLVLLSIYLVTQSSYHRVLEQSGYAAAVARLALNFPLMVYFAVLYFLAIFYKRQPNLHMRYMSSTAFVMMGPALARALILFQVSNFDARFYAARIVIVLIAGAITLVDSARTKRVSPFALVLGFTVLHAIFWEERQNAFWQTIGSMAAKMF